MAPFFIPDKNFEPQTFISIIIPARNEEKNIGALLHSIAQLHYPSHLFEVIVVDDFSEDGTAKVAGQYPFVKLIRLKDHLSEKINSYKKKAIETGITESRGTLVVTTDADCTVKPGWLTTIAAYFEKTGKQFFTMPVVFSGRKSLLEIFQVLDFMTLQGITGASVNKGSLSMANGANLAYTKAAFLAVNGFKGIDNIASGDDMLLMHKIALQFPGQTGYLKSKEVIVETKPMPTVKDFFAQRIRWASKADKYEDKRVFAVLLLVYFFNLAMMVMLIWALVSMEWHLLIGWLYLIAAKTIVELIFLFPVAQFFSRRAMLWFFPLMQPFHILYTVIAGLLGRFGKYEWKGRSVN